MRSRSAPKDTTQALAAPRSFARRGSDGWPDTEFDGVLLAVVLDGFDAAPGDRGQRLPGEVRADRRDAGLPHRGPAASPRGGRSGRTHPEVGEPPVLRLGDRAAFAGDD